jgi:hypothetical protein
VHAFCRDGNKLDDKDKALCTSTGQGDAFRPKDLEHALAQTRADVVVICIASGDSVNKSYNRAVSSAGAGYSRIIVGGGLRKLISLHLRHVLADHTGQENAIRSLRNRTTIVRAPYLTENEATGKLVYFQDREKSPTNKTDRADFTAWIAEEVFVAE